MNLTLSLIICPIIFSVLFIIETCFFLYKLIHRRNTDDEGMNTIDVTPREVKYCMGWVWKFAVDERTNQIKLSIFVVWYFVSICFDLFITGMIFLIVYYN